MASGLDAGSAEVAEIKVLPEEPREGMEAQTPGTIVGTWGEGDRRRSAVLVAPGERV